MRRAWRAFTRPLDCAQHHPANHAARFSDRRIVPHRRGITGRREAKARISLSSVRFSPAPLRTWRPSASTLSARLPTSVRLPVYALAALRLENAPLCIEAGAARHRRHLAHSRNMRIAARHSHATPKASRRLAARGSVRSHRDSRLLSIFPSHHCVLWRRLSGGRGARHICRRRRGQCDRPADLRARAARRYRPGLDRGVAPQPRVGNPGRHAAPALVVLVVPLLVRAADLEPVPDQHFHWPSLLLRFDRPAVRRGGRRDAVSRIRVSGAGESHRSFRHHPADGRPVRLGAFATI